jgi:hypothetical protein
LTFRVFRVFRGYYQKHQESIVISLDLQTFRQSRKTGNVTGVIFLELQHGPFPEAGWSDFPVIILGWWIEAWLQLETSAKRREVQWRFMDGPYYATLTATDAQSPDAFAFCDVKGSLLQAGEHVIAHCEHHGMLSRDLEPLRANVQRLNKNQIAKRNASASFVHFKTQQLQ